MHDNNPNSWVLTPAEKVLFDSLREAMIPPPESLNKPYSVEYELRNYHFDNELKRLHESKNTR